MVSHMGPMLLLGALLLGLCLIVGVLVISAARGNGRSAHRCPACGKSNRPGAKFCAHCGQPLRNA